MQCDAILEVERKKEVVGQNNWKDKDTQQN
jgi:hypothetical protein